MWKFLMRRASLLEVLWLRGDLERSWTVVGHFDKVGVDGEDEGKETF